MTRGENPHTVESESPAPAEGQTRRIKIVLIAISEFRCGHRGEQLSFHAPEGVVERRRLVSVVHLNMPAFNFDLARRMNRPAPRYTSYPTAPHLHAGFGETAYAAELDRRRTAPAEPLSLYFPRTLLREAVLLLRLLHEGQPEFRGHRSLQAV